LHSNLDNVAERLEDKIVAISGVTMRSDSNLPEIVQARNAFGLFFGFGKSGQKQGRQYGDNGNDHEQLD
jgi:hypothetical protein